MRPFLFLICCLLFTHQLWSQVAGEKSKLLEPFLLDPVAKGGPISALARYIPGHLAYAVDADKLSRKENILRTLPGHISIINVKDLPEWLSYKNSGIALVPVNDKWKLSPELLAGIDLEPIKTGSNKLIIGVNNFNDFIGKHGSELKIIEQDLSAKTFRVQASDDWIHKRGLSDDNIIFIATSRIAHTERELTGFDLSANLVNTAHRYWPGISGNGLTVSIKENRMDTADIDFSGRYVYSPGASTLMQTHATTMATIVAGGGNSFYTGKGVAWGSRISSSDFANLLPDDAQSLIALNVSVQNHSYGTAIENYYGADARAYDLQAANLPYLLHVFSAGNSGNETSANGNYAGITGMANLTGSFKMAKNVLVVAAMDSIGSILPPISKGPAFDGRVKPELVAFGEDGSSGAAAIASGLAILLQDTYKQLNNQLPSSSLVKAIMINSATDVGPAGIDYFSGYGAINAFKAIKTVGEHRFNLATIGKGETSSYRISIPDNARNLKVTLSWTDPAAIANSATALVNDLDLEILNQSSSEKWLPWVLNSFPNLDSLQQLPVRKRDSLNNIEQVSLAYPVGGTYTINVKGYSLLTNQQDYAICWEYDTLNSFQFSYPVKGDNIVPGKKNTIRWSSVIDGQGTLEYRLDGSPDWQVANNAVNLPLGYFKWQAPDLFANIQFRMKTSDLQVLSDTVSLSDNLFIKTGFNCIDSFLIYWQKAPAEANGNYRLYSLHEKYLESSLEVNDTAVVQNKANNPDEWFTVAPILKNGIEGIKAYTFNYTQQQTGCYIRNFLADPAEINQARLTLELGTTYGVKRIQFEKRNNTNYVAVGELSPVNSILNVFTTAAQDGLNIYRALVELENGTTYYTTPESVYQFENHSYFIFPNPVQKGNTIRILTKEPENSWFVLYDMLGRKVLTTELTNTIQEIDVSRMQSGVYFYNIFKDGIRTVSNKLVIQ
ncbi:S8 family serine peptidase [Flavihumibacter profundi]|uniref:S8 family serine peptidase n=1 Tax=Flavihumibacter profundi TaxID=2716883 RepID=UPI001CC45EAA|nr:S8 family serine peptidase [Flavihumibacter profundi]MBZ5858321.1 S8 family serine peptidase [Flavihumibacter profundi]